MDNSCFLQEGLSHLQHLHTLNVSRNKLKTTENIEELKKYTPRRGDVVFFSKSNYINFLHLASNLQKYNLSHNDRNFMWSEATFPDPFLFRINEITPFQGTTKNVLLIALQGYKSTKLKLTIKYLNIGGFSKFLWPHQILSVRKIGVL